MNATEQAIALCEAAKAAFAKITFGLADFDCNKLPQAVFDYLEEHPGTTAFQLVCLLVVLVPGLIAGPGLLALGFGPAGPMAGWLAATFQSMYGVNVAFSTLQSAAMGGYGVAIVNSIIQTVGFLPGGITWMFNWKSMNGTQAEL